MVSDKMTGCGLSVKQLAETSGIPRTTLARRLTGNSPFTVSELGAIAPLLDTTAVALLAEAEGRAA